MKKRSQNEKRKDARSRTMEKVEEVMYLLNERRDHACEWRERVRGRIVTESEICQVGQMHRLPDWDEQAVRKKEKEEREQSIVLLIRYLVGEGSGSGAFPKRALITSEQVVCNKERELLLPNTTMTGHFLTTLHRNNGIKCITNSNGGRAQTKRPRRANKTS